ncbi:MAG: sulfate adenylyltransferase, partial [bacterium]
MGSDGLIRAHGGNLVNRFLPESEAEIWRDKKDELETIVVDHRQESDLEMIAMGAFSPLEGFMGKEDHESVVEDMELSDGTVWPIPITLSVSQEKADSLPDEGAVALENEDGDFLAVLHLREKYTIDNKKRAEAVFRTADDDHPGVEWTYNMGDVQLGGEVDVLKQFTHKGFQDYRLTPEETREYFADQGWESVVGFQTRNPMHRAHEYLAKCALENVDGLLIHPL